MERLRRLKPILLFHLCLNAAVVLFVTGASYYHTPLEGFKDTAVYLLHLIALQSTVAGILYFLSLHRWLFRILFSLLFLGYCCFSFWAYSQDISITPSLIQAVFETQPDIAVDVITWPYLLFFLLALGSLVGLMKWYSKLSPRQGMKLLVWPALLCLLVYFVIESKRPGTLDNRLPYNVVQGLSTYYEAPELILETEVAQAVAKSDSVKVVFVLGETVRADHLGLNGYERNTTPLLERIPNLISYPNLYTTHTYTGASVPQILTDRSLSDQSGNSDVAVYTVAQQAGIATTWIGNQTLEKSFSPIVEQNEEVILIDAFKSEFSFDKELDEAMLPILDTVLRQNNRQLVTLQMIGSHWWYENRYEDRHRIYTPVIDSKYIPSLSREQLINSYDNTLHYLDFFLDEVIQRLQQDSIPTAMLFVADHGEYMGENGKWLHAQPGEELQNPGYIIWLSEAFIQRYPEKAAQLKAGTKGRLSTDVIFHQVLDLLDVEYTIDTP